MVAHESGSADGCRGSIERAARTVAYQPVAKVADPAWSPRDQFHHRHHSPFYEGIGAILSDVSATTCIYCGLPGRMRTGGGRQACFSRRLFAVEPLSCQLGLDESCELVCS